MTTNHIMKEATAYHEAAHAVLALTIPLEIVKITINPEEDSEGSYEGGCEVDLKGFFNISLNNIRNASIELIKFHLAGKIAEQKYFQEKSIDPNSMLKNSACYDNAQVEYYIKTNYDNGEIPIELNIVSEETSKKVNTPEIWSAIRDLAGILVQARQLEENNLTRALAPIFVGLNLADCKFRDGGRGA